MKYLIRFNVLFVLLLSMHLFSITVANAQQTIQFSQYVFNGLAVNPAYAGYKEDLTVNLSFRSQWVGIEGAPRTGIASVDGLTKNPDKKVGFGLIAITDRLGAQNTSSVYANYAYRLRFDAEDTKRLSFGFAFGATQYNLDGSKFIATDPGDGAIPVGNQSKLSPDVRFGVYYYTPKFYIGASAVDLLTGGGDTVTSNGYKIIKQMRHIYLTGGVMIPLSESFDLKPTFMVKEDFKGPTNLDLNAYLLINKTIWIGASYRTGVRLWDKTNLQKGLDQNDAISGILEVFINPRFRVGYSYDYTTSKLSNYQQGSHEISVSFSLPGKRESVISPRFF
jgi:type IX secretion system PorP/SprF family membrane protein